MTFSHLAPRLERRSFAAGRTIFEQGEPGDCAYLVESGTVGIYQHVDGRRVELGTVTHGEIFGELGAIDGGARMATAIALDRCELTRIPKAVFDRKLGESDRVIRTVLNIFLRSIRSGHRTFLRRPRSVQDHLRLMASMADDLHAFCHHAEGEEAYVLEGALKKLDLAILEVERCAARCPDKRHDTIVDAPLSGVAAE